MFHGKDDLEVRKLVTFYIIYTIIYLPTLLATLFWSDGIYLVGKYKFQSILIIIGVAELTKYFASVLHFKVNDVNLSRKQDEKSVICIIRSLFSKQKLKEAIKTVITMVAMMAVYFVIAVLYGAELLTKHEETLMFSFLLSVLTIFPACINLGSGSVLTMVLGTKPTDRLEALVYQNLYFTIGGAWLGAFVIPLDWDRPWQKWPIPCSVGAMVGFALSHVVMMFRNRQPKSKAKSR